MRKTRLGDISVKIVLAMKDNREIIAKYLYQMEEKRKQLSHVQKITLLSKVQ